MLTHVLHLLFWLSCGQKRLVQLLADVVLITFSFAMAMQTMGGVRFGLRAIYLEGGDAPQAWGLIYGDGSAGSSRTCWPFPPAMASRTWCGRYFRPPAGKVQQKATVPNMK